MVGGNVVVERTLIPASGAARQILELVRSGYRFQASVGVSVTEYARVKGSLEVNGRTVENPTGGLVLVKRSVLNEVSIVAIGADGQTSVAIAAQRKEVSMNEAENKVEEVFADEPKRIETIREICAGRFVEIETQAIDEGWDAQRTKLAVLRASRPAVPSIHASPEPPSRAVLEAAILAHMGCEHLAEKHLGADVTQRAHDLRATNLVDLCRVAVEPKGIDAPHGRDGMIRAAFSTINLPVALGDATNKLLLESYSESPATWQSFAAIKSANNFKQHIGTRPTQARELEHVALEVS